MIYFSFSELHLDMKASELKMEDVKHLSGMGYLKSLRITLKKDFTSAFDDGAAVRKVHLVATHAAGVVPHLETFEYHYVHEHGRPNNLYVINAVIEEYGKQFPAKKLLIKNVM
jgi:hypothetical protein